MQPADIYCFSGTGNTWLAAARLRQILAEEGAGAQLHRLECADPARIEPARALGIAFPIAAFGTYPVVTAFLDRLPPGGGAAVFLLATMGGNSLHYPARLHRYFTDKGYRPAGAREVVMPDNLLGVLVNEDKNQRVREAGLAETAVFARALIAGTAQWPAAASGAALAGRLNRGAFSSRVARYLMQPKVRTGRCTGCGLCARLCPAGCLQMTEGKAAMTAGCQFCQRCRGICPAGAITLGVGKAYAVAGWRETLQ